MFYKHALLFLCPHHKMVRGHLVFALSGLSSFRPSVIPSEAENSRSACFDWYNFIWTGIQFEILVHISLFGLALFVKLVILTCLFKKISASLHSVLPSHQSLSSQLLLHPCMDLNETWYRCCTTSLEVHVGR